MWDYSEAHTVAARLQLGQLDPCCILIAVNSGGCPHQRDVPFYLSYANNRKVFVVTKFEKNDKPHIYIQRHELLEFAIFFKKKSNLSSPKHGKSMATASPAPP